MPLSDDLKSLFAKTIVNREQKPSTAQTLNATVVNDSGNLYVKIDGSDQLTPVTTTSTIKDGERVTVTIKNHSAIVTGNITSPSASSGDVGELGDKIAEFDTIIADVVTTDDLTAIYADIENLTADNVTIKGELDAANASIDNLEADNVTINGKLTAAEGEIDDLYANKLDVEVANAKFATIENLEATNADIHNLEADYGEFKELATGKFTAVDASIGDLEANKLSVTDADIRYANIDFANIGSAAIENFFSKSGMIEDLVVGDQTITGKLVGVTIVGDLIEGGTIKADKLVVQGTDGLYYKLNVSGETVAAEQTEYNSLNGSIITAQSITAEKISVSDLVAFDATIGGFNITDSAIYSGVKESVMNDTRGIYMDNTGQYAVGDDSNYIRFFKDTDDTWKLAISASAISIGVAKKDLDQVLEDLNDKIDNVDVGDVEIGARNLVLDSDETQIISELTGTAEYEISTFGQSLMKVDERFTISFDAMSTLADVGIVGGLYGASITHALPATIHLTNDWTRYTIDVQLTSNESTKVMFSIVENASDPFEVSIQNVKVERGTVNTDWTPAPEDMATSDDVQEAQQAANDANAMAENSQNRVAEAESQITVLADSIKNLVTDENGTSMMTQTSDGWTFNISGIQTALNDATENIQNIQGDVTEAEAAIDQANSLINDIANKTAYIVMKTDEEGDPYIELGREDNEFKLRITNTSVDFMQGSNRVAYVTNQQLYIETAVIKNELRIGESPGFIWKTRANGNMGLRREA